MSSRRLMWVVLCVIVAAGLHAADRAQLVTRLDDAEQVRATDKSKALAMLRDVERDPLTHSDPELIARVQALECAWASTPADAYRAYAIGMPAAERANSIPLRARLYACHAAALMIDNREADAEREYNTALALARQANDRRLEAQQLDSVGYLQYLRGAMGDALANLNAMYKLAEQLHDEKLRLEALSMIANVYADPTLAQYDRAIEYYRQMLAIYEKAAKPKDAADTLFNMASTFSVKGDLAASERHYRQALAAFQKIDDQSDVYFTERALALTLVKQGRAAEALKLLDAVIGYYDRARNESELAMARQYRGIANRTLGRRAEALADLDAARRFYEREDNTRFLERNALETARAYSELGDWHNAFDAQARHDALQQKLADMRRDEISSRLRVQFDSEKKDAENRALARENALRVRALQEAERSRRLQIVATALSILLALALAILFWRQVVNTRRMRSMAMTDDLTRLPNRRHILAVADITFAAAKREQRPVAVIIFDLDGFKRINDVYGHAAGDSVLQSVARACRLELRGGDQVGRIGGEEFLVILNSADAEYAGGVAERLRAAVARLDFSSISPDLRVTISLGVRIATDYDVTAVIAAADELLYRAKHNGRNRVELAVA